MKKDKINIEKCPWCKTNKHLTVWKILGSSRHYCISCSKCGCKGPLKEFEDENNKTIFNTVVAAWNKYIKK